jgi:uncharacterized membrane protein
LASIVCVRLRAGSGETPAFRFSNRAWRVALAVLCIVHVGYAGLHLRKAHILDIARSTLTAGEVIVDGGNPYRCNCDPDAVHLMEASGVTNAQERYGGYKYLPLMATAYLPLGLPFDARGVIVTNLALMALLLWSVWRLTCAIAGDDAARWAVLFLGTTPLLIFQLYAKGVTDIVPILLLVVALPLIERRPVLAGLLVGGALSAKLIPAALLLPLFVPAPGVARARYLIGAAIALVPTGLYFAWAPQAFIDNIVMFNALRPIGETSWMWGQLHDLAPSVRAVFLVGWGAAVAFTFLRSPTIELRCGIAALVIIGSVLAAPVMDQNYMIWWLPFIAPILVWPNPSLANRATQSSRGPQW